VPIQDLIGQYYVDAGADYRSTFLPGQLYWAPTFYLPPHPDVLFEVRPDPAEQNLTFEVRRATGENFRGSHRPLKSIGLEAEEELVAVKAKQRLVVLLSQPNTVLEDLRGVVAKGTKIHEQSFFCLPLYGVHRGGGQRGFPEVVVERIQALMYPQFFYFPASSGESRPIVYEAIGRLDRLQVLHQDTLQANAVPFRLEPNNCLWVLREWVRAYLTGEMSATMLALRTELTRELYA
jgi:hypothetical protein